MSDAYRVASVSDARTLINRIRFADAALCLNCETVFSIREVWTCPGCGSGQFATVAKWLSERR